MGLRLFCRFVSFALLGIAVAAAYESVAQQRAPAAAPPGVPTAEATLKYLNQTIEWYRHVAEQEQFAADASDTMFLNDDRQASKQILRLSFDFAKAQAQLLAKQSAAATAAQPGEDSESARYQSLTKAAADADAEVKSTRTELDGVKQKLATASDAARGKLQATVDELQSELNLAQARSQNLHTVLQYATTNTASSGNLMAQITEMESSIPELAAEAAKVPNEPTAPSAAAPVATTSLTTPPANRREPPTGILGLTTDLFELNHKVQKLQDSIASTNALLKSSQALRSPLLGSLRAAAGRGDEYAKQADTSNAAQLEVLKKQLDTLTEEFRQVSNAMIPLQRQSILIPLEINTLTHWHDSVRGQFVEERRSLLVRVSALGFAILIVVILAELWQRATLRYVRDPRRRYQFLLLRRIVMWLAIGITVAFGLATEIGSLATFAGLITAGIAVALQNVILAIAGYFFLIGKYGVRVGDRVQISGVTGNVVDIGLIRLHMMELSGDGNGQQPTGRVVVFSNSIVFQSSASFFKQIPGTNFGWREVTFILAPNSDYIMAEKRILDVIEKVYAGYRDKIEFQARQMERSFSLPLDVPKPTSRLRLTPSGLEVVIRYPVDLENSSQIDDQITRELLDALEQPPKLRLVGSGVPNIQPVTENA
jgi:small-conductance mechanosensitive channel